MNRANIYYLLHRPPGSALLHFGSCSRSATSSATRLPIHVALSKTITSVTALVYLEISSALLADAFGGLLSRNMAEAGVRVRPARGRYSLSYSGHSPALAAYGPITPSRPWASAAPAKSRPSPGASLRSRGRLPARRRCRISTPPSCTYPL